MFPSSLKSVAYDWFYSLPRHSLWSFEEVTQVFYHQYVSRRELKKNSNHHFTTKMKPGVSLKYEVISNAKWPWCITVTTMWLPLHSSVDCKSSTLFTNTWWSMKSLGCGISSLGLRNAYRSGMLLRAKPTALPDKGMKGRSRNHSLFPQRIKIGASEQ